MSGAPDQIPALRFDLEDLSTPDITAKAQPTYERCLIIPGTLFPPARSLEEAW
jgi:hypothetical protein